MAALTAKSKLPNVQAPQPRKRYQIYSILKAYQTISEIALLLGRNRSTLSRELILRLAGLEALNAKHPQPPYCG